MRFVEGQLITQRYRVESLIGTGSGGEIYKVWDEKRSTHLALKLLKPEWSDNPELIASFVDEARSLSMLQHSNIVRYYEMVREDGLVFFLMDFIQGVTLRKLLKEAGKPLPLPTILSIMAPICRALNYAHEQGVIHCDVKPENILIDQDDNVFLTDFGIAHSSETNADIIRSAGTPAYMAPEQIQKKHLTPQTDLYALGIILFEMFTGRKPFNGDTAPSHYSLTDRIRWEQQYRMPPPPDQLIAFSGANPSDVILKCLAKDPHQRFSNALTLLEALENLRMWDIPEKTEQTVNNKSGDDLVIKRHKTLLPILAGVAVFIIVIGLALTSSGGSGELTKSNSVVTQYNACMEIDLSLQEKSTLFECVKSVNINDNGSMKVNFVWKLESVSPTIGVTIQADTNNHNMYLLDDLGNRLDHISTGGGTNQSVTLKSGGTKEGWFLFPALSPDANGFFFVDEDNQVRTELLSRNW